MRNDLKTMGYGLILGLLVGFGAGFYVSHKSSGVDELRIEAERTQAYLSGLEATLQRAEQHVIRYKGKLYETQARVDRLTNLLETSRNRVASLEAGISRAIGRGSEVDSGLQRLGSITERINSAIEAGERILFELPTGSGGKD